MLPSGPDHPAMQWHAVKEALAPSDVEPRGQVVQLDFVVAPRALEYEPVLQSVHETASEDAVSVSSSGSARTLYLPGTHAVHVCTSLVCTCGNGGFPQNPASHVQYELPTAECEFLAHCQHVVAPAVPENV